MSNATTGEIHVKQWAGIDRSDHPDYCDAYIVRATINGRWMTDEEVEALNNDGAAKLELLYKHLY